jgi:hypothetical protein
MEATMATLLMENGEADDDSTDFKLGANSPGTWKPTGAYSVEITYKTIGGERVYEYKDAPTSPDFPLLPGATSFFQDQLKADDGLKALASAENGDQSLDLKITSDCIVIMRTDDEKEMTWSVDDVKQAIMTKGVGREGMYFGLRLIDQGISYLPGKFPTGRVCKQISFGAKLNTGGKPGDGHPFALNVIIEGTEDRIDPDIRNPGLA